MIFNKDGTPVEPQKEKIATIVKDDENNKQAAPSADECNSENSATDSTEGTDN